MSAQLQTQAKTGSKSPDAPTANNAVKRHFSGQRGFSAEAQRYLIQAKLKIGQPGDKYEQEADRVAEQVMRMPAPGNSVATGFTTPTQPLTIQKMCPECKNEIQQQPLEEEEEELIQTKRAGNLTPGITPSISSGIQSLQGGGRTLSGSERSFFEPRFGADFSNVRVHNDPHAASVAGLVNARAFTLGRNVVFGTGEYSPYASSGRKLLAHELTHVVQQNGGTTLYSTGKNSKVTRFNSQKFNNVPGIHENIQEPSLNKLIQRHNIDGGCDTAAVCLSVKQGFLSILRRITRGNVQTWRNEQNNLRIYIQGLNSSDASSLQIMLGIVGNNLDPELSRDYQNRLQQPWRLRVVTWLSSQVEQDIEWEEEWEGEEEVEEERTVPERRTRGRRYLRQIEIGNATYRVGFQSRELQIRSIFREWNGTVWITYYHAGISQERTETVSQFHTLMSAHDIASATEAMGAIAQAEAAVLAEIFPGARLARIPANIIWAGLICYSYREQIRSLIEEVSQLNTTLTWLQENTPSSLQIFIVRIFSVRIGAQLPSELSPTDIGRDIGRTLRDFHVFARLILSLVRTARGSAAAGVSASLRIFVTAGGPLIQRIPHATSRIHRIMNTLRPIVEALRPFVAAARRVQSGAAAPIRIRDRIAIDTRQAIVAELAENLGITADNPEIDNVIREFTNGETEQKLIQALNAFRNFIELCDTLSDALEH